MGILLMFVLLLVGCISIVAGGVMLFTNQPFHGYVVFAIGLFMLVAANNLEIPSDPESGGE